MEWFIGCIGRQRRIFSRLSCLPYLPMGRLTAEHRESMELKKASAWRTQRPTRKETYTTPPQVWYKAFTIGESIVSHPFEFLLFPVCYT